MFNLKTLGLIIAQEIVSIDTNHATWFKVWYKIDRNWSLMKQLTDSIRKNTTIDINVFGKSIHSPLHRHKPYILNHLPPTDH